jgi:hypothetical protein
MKTLRVIAAVVLVTAGALVAAASARIIDTSGAVQQIAPPPSVEFQQLESDTTIFAFDEQQCVNTVAPLLVDITAPGTYDDRSDLTPGVIPAGMRVRSHFLHADPVGQGNRIELEGSIKTNQVVIGIAVLSSSLDGSDSLGAPGTTYPTLAFARGLELDRQNDFVVLDAKSRRVTVHVDADDHADQVRVITRCHPLR